MFQSPCDCTQRRPGLVPVLLCLLCTALIGAGHCASAQTVPGRASSGDDETARDSSSQRAANENLDRAERLRRRRRSKARSGHAPDPGFFEKVDRSVVKPAISVLSNRIALKVPELGLSGLQPVFGKTGGGFTSGLLYEPPFAREKDQLLSFEAVGGLNRYYRGEVLFGIERGRYVGYAFARYRHRPEEKFFGIGSGSKKADESTFRLNEGLFGALGGRSLGENALVGGHLSYQFNRVRKGRGTGPQVRKRFGDGLPGGTGGTDHLMVGAFFEYDSRNASSQRAFGHRFAPTENRLRSVSLEASRGFYLSTEVTHNVDTQAEQFGFTRYTLDAREFIPIDEELLHGFAFRQFASFTQSGEGEVPFYRLQSIGGSRSLRGYEGGRFRDRNVVLVNAEVRCQIWHQLDMALFTDAGHVFNDVDGLGEGGVHVGYGVGFRYRKDGKTLGRIDLARSDEGMQVTLDLGSLF